MAKKGDVEITTIPNPAKEKDEYMEMRREQLKEAQKRYFEMKKKQGFVKMQAFVRKGYVQRLKTKAAKEGMTFDDFMNKFVREALKVLQ